MKRESRTVVRFIPVPRSGSSSWLYCPTNYTLRWTFTQHSIHQNMIFTWLCWKTVKKYINIYFICTAANCYTFVWCKDWEVEKYLDPLLETISAVSKTPHPNLPFCRCEVFTAVTAIKDEKASHNIDPLCHTPCLEFARYLQMTILLQKFVHCISFYKLRVPPRQQWQIFWPITGLTISA